MVWELEVEEVKEGQGRHPFRSGSHKAHFSYGGLDRFASSAEGSPWLESIYGAMDTYGCPAGSVVIFTESLLHAARMAGSYRVRNSSRSPRCTNRTL